MDAKSDKELAVELAQTFITVFIRQSSVKPITSDALPAILKNAYRAVKEMDK